MASNNADFSCTFTVQNSDGTAYDLTNADLEMQFKPYPSAGPGMPMPVAITTASTASGGLTVLTPPTSGQFSLYLPFTTMALFSARTYSWDILQNNNSGSRTFFGGGTFSVTEGVTENP